MHPGMLKHFGVIVKNLKAMDRKLYKKLIKAAIENLCLTLMRSVIR